jgi:DNA polymerase III alpha subunit
MNLVLPLAGKANLGQTAQHSERNNKIVKDFYDIFFKNHIINLLSRYKITLEKINKLYPDDYSQAEKLEFQKQLLGYYLDSPLELFELRGGYTIKNAISSGVEGEEAMLEVMVTQIDFATTRPKNNSPGSQYAKLTVTDGIQNTLIFMWNNELSKQDPSNLLPGCGLRMRVKFDKERHTFTVARSTNLIKLRLKDFD